MISILIPVFNEETILEASAGKVHSRLDTFGIEHELLIIDNGSTDRTEEIGRRLDATNPRTRYFRLPERGPGRAFVHGIRNARGESILTLDADLSSDLIFLKYAADLLNYGDMVVGSKSFGKQRRSPLRILGSQGYILVTQLLFDLTIADYSMGCKAFRRVAAEGALEHLDPWTGYIFELALYFKLRDYKIIQVGIDCDDNRPSRFNVMHEGFYRFRHLKRCWSLLRDKNSWLNTA